MSPNDEMTYHIVNRHLFFYQYSNIYERAVKKAGEPWVFNIMGFHRDKLQIPRGLVAEKIGEHLPECSIRFSLGEGPPRTLKGGVVEVHEWPQLN